LLSPNSKRRNARFFHLADAHVPGLDVAQFKASSMIKKINYFDKKGVEVFISKNS